MIPEPANGYFDSAETLPREHLIRNRRRALGEIVDHASRWLPFYRSHWGDVEVQLNGGMDEVSFRALPVTKKGDLVRAARTAASMSVGIEALAGLAARNVVMTSGTMGFNTFAMVTDHDLDGASTLAQARELWMIGVRPEMRVLSISPAWHALGLFESRALTRIGAIPVMPWGTLTPRFAGDLLTAVTRLQPEHLLLTARALRLLLAECDRLRLDSRQIFRSVRFVGCAGESLTSVFRSHVEQRLGLEYLFERGGSSDGMFGGGECVARRGHHISADVHYVEIIDPRTGEAVEEGQRGTAVVTNLTLGKSLYIRFDTEDVAEIVPGDCPCGRTHPVVEFYSRLADSVVVGNRIVTAADAREILDEFEETRFKPLSIAPRGGHDLVVTVGGIPEERWNGVTNYQDVLSERLGVTTTVESAGTTDTGWKGERVARRGVAR